MPVVGVLYPGSLANIAKAIAAFRKGLSEMGYAEGRNAENDNARLPELAAELVRRQVKSAIGQPHASRYMASEYMRSGGVWI